YSRSGKLDDSLRVLDELVEARTTTRGRQNVRTINPLVLRSSVLTRMSRLDEAEADCRRLIAALGSRQGVDSLRVIAGTRLAQLLETRHDYAAAEDVLNRQLQVTAPEWREPLFDKLHATYSAWAAHDPSADLKPKLQALSARRAELQAAPAQVP
ncbi:MAG: hypothetical protein ACK5P8_02690, partial [Phycisphaerae bacterium]